MKRKRWRVAGINFDHFHMGDLLRFAHEHPQAEIVGISDEQPARMEEVIRKLGIRREQCFSDYGSCLAKTKPDLVLLCPAAAHHGDWVQKVAPFNVHILVEKPFAGSLKEADAMIRAMVPGRTLMINWPAQWDAGHQKAHQLIEEGRLGEVLNVWYFGGNRGPLWHGAGKALKTTETVAAEK
ncbi:MAG: Gfo/Idh/MocA family oxidoreductase, partial [Verrucomicrobiota bacterium]